MLLILVLIHFCRIQANCLQIVRRQCCLYNSCLDAPGCVESLDMTDELESALSQAAETTEKEEEVKKTKKNKKKKNNNNPENNVDSSADDFKEVEVKPKKKKNKKQANVEEREKESEPSPVVQKEKTPEPEVKEKTPENDPAPQPVPRKLKNKKKQELELEEEKGKKEEEQLAEEFVGFEPEEEKFEGFETSKTPESFIPVESPTVEETATAMFEEFSKRSPPTKDGVSPNRDLVEFSEEESVVRVIEAEEDVEEEEEDKVEFFIKEKSSSLEPEESNMTSSGIDPMAARPNPWFEKFLKKSSSMIEDQIFGAVKKYEDVEEKGSDEEEGMEELEKNQADTEKNIADLLEDDEDLMMEPKIIASQPPSSNLSQLLKGEGGKKTHVDDSSDDDFMFRPVVQQQKKNKKQKKQKGQVLSLEEFHRCLAKASHFLFRIYLYCPTEGKICSSAVTPIWIKLVHEVDNTFGAPARCTHQPGAASPVWCRVQLAPSRQIC